MSTRRGQGYTIRVDDRRLKALLRNIADVPDMRVGVIGAAATAQHVDSEDTVGGIAAIHELGAGVPRRSWLRDWVDTNLRSEIRKQWLRAVVATADGLAPATAFGRAAAVFVGSIQERIAAGISPANAPATIARKGSSTPLIYKGQLRTAITWALDK